MLVGVGEGVDVGVRELVSEDVAVSLGVSDDVNEGVSVDVALLDAENDGVMVSLAVKDGVSDEDGVKVGDGVFDGDGVMTVSAMGILDTVAPSKADTSGTSAGYTPGLAYGGTMKDTDCAEEAPKGVSRCAVCSCIGNCTTSAVVN